MIFFPIICTSLFIAIPRIISAAPVSKRVVIDNNRSDDYDKQSAWNEGETKSKDEESGNFEDNHQNPWRPQPIVQSMLQNNDDAVHIERTQGYNGVDNYLPPEEYEEISPPLDRCSGDDCKCPEGMTGVQPFCSPVDPVNQVEPQDKCIGDSCKCPPGMVGVEPFCRPADPEGRTAVEGDDAEKEDGHYYWTDGSIVSRDDPRWGWEGQVKPYGEGPHCLVLRPWLWKGYDRWAVTRCRYRGLYICEIPTSVEEAEEEAA